MSDKKFPHMVVARINEYVEPMDRGTRYEDPLEAILAEKKIGAVTGGGSQLNEQFKIVHVDVEMELADVSTSLVVVQEELEKLGVPFGSELRFSRNGNNINRPIGQLETVELYLDGVNLSPQVYEDLDFQSFYEAIERALLTAKAGAARSTWSGPEETGIFLFGPKAAAIHEVLAGMLPAHPILQNARVVMKVADAKAKPKEVRLPKVSSSTRA